MDGLLETNLVVEEFLDLPHAVPDDQLQLLLLDMQLLHLPVAMFGSTIASALALFGGHGAGKVGTWLFELGLSLLHLFKGHVLTFLNGDVPQYLVLLPEFLQDVIPGDVLAGLLAEVSAIDCILGVLLQLCLGGGEVAGVDLFDGLVGVDCGFFLVEGGKVLVDFLEGLLHFYFGTGQHLATFNYFELYLTVIQQLEQIQQITLGLFILFQTPGNSRLPSSSLRLSSNEDASFYFHPPTPRGLLWQIQSRFHRTRQLSGHFSAQLQGDQIFKGDLGMLILPVKIDLLTNWFHFLYCAGMIPEEEVQRYIKEGFSRAGCVNIHPLSCNQFCFNYLFTTWTNSYRTYGAVYLFQLLFRLKNISKQPLREGLKFILSYLKSTSLTAVQMMLMRRVLCFLCRHYSNKQSNLLVANFLSALYLVIEPNSRRVEIALYQVRNTTEVMYNMAKRRGFVKGMRYGEGILFGVAMMVLMYYYYDCKQAFKSTYIRTLFSYLSGQPT